MYEWKILGITADDDGFITQARYHVSLEEKNKKIETEGNWFFYPSETTIPFDQITEEIVVEWIKKEATKDGKNTVECRLNEQLKAMALQRDTVAPWMPQIFTPKI